MKNLFLCLALGLPALASAQSSTIYLHCSFPATADSPANRVDFTLNESNGTVVVKGTGSTSRTSQAAFGPDTITWSDDLGHNSMLATTINRTDLSIVQTLNLMGHEQTPETGSCKVIHPPKRKV